MPCITLISALIVLATVIELLLFFAIYRVTSHLFSVRLLVNFTLLMLDPFEVLSGEIW